MHSSMNLRLGPKKMKLKEEKKLSLLKLLNENEKKIFFAELQKLDFDFKHLKAA